MLVVPDTGTVDVPSPKSHDPATVSSPPGSCTKAAICSATSGRALAGTSSAPMTGSTLTIVTVSESEAVTPTSSVTVTVAVNVPFVAYVWTATGPSLVAPSP